MLLLADVHKCIRTVGAHTPPGKRGPEQHACTMGKGDVVSNVHNHRQSSNACHDARNANSPQRSPWAITHIGVFVNPSRLQLVKCVDQTHSRVRTFVGTTLNSLTSR
jgi:hypothetical protein